MLVMFRWIRNQAYPLLYILLLLSAVTQIFESNPHKKGTNHFGARILFLSELERSKFPKIILQKDLIFRSNRPRSP